MFEPLFLPGDVVLLPSGAIAEVTGIEGSFLVLRYMERGSGTTVINRRYVELISHARNSPK